NHQALAYVYYEEEAGRRSAAGFLTRDEARWREAEKLIGEDGALQMVDPLCVIETCMRYFYSLAQTGRKANAPLDEVRKCFEKAAHLAALAAPYRHPRLSAVKLNKDPVDPALRQEASLEKLKAEMLKHWERLAPVLDLEALIAPTDGSANRDAPEGAAGHD